MVRLTRDSCPEHYRERTALLSQMQWDSVRLSMWKKDTCAAWVHRTVGVIRTVSALEAHYIFVECSVHFHGCLIAGENPSIGSMAFVGCFMFVLWERCYFVLYVCFCRSAIFLLFRDLCQWYICILPWVWHADLSVTCKFKILRFAGIVPCGTVPGVSQYVQDEKCPRIAGCKGPDILNIDACTAVYILMGHVLKLHTSFGNCLSNNLQSITGTVSGYVWYRFRVGMVLF